MKSIKAIFRRGQNPKLDGQNLGDNLSRTSSITNLESEQRSSKGARPRKSASRDRIDKIGDKKHDKKGLNKNNNKLDAVENTTYPSVDSLPEEELLHLRRQLQEMAQEKTNLALQLGEQKGQLNNLQKEIQKLKDESNLQMDQLTEENSRLRKRLKDVAHSPLSDNEKQQLLFNTHRHHHSSSAPASIATNIVEDGSGPDTTCTTPDWDKHSSSNVSEVSVACLQDKINQMQETHYSTNEELQATLQELTDLQRQLTELQQENERLNDEKNLMFDSLCRQTERLNDSRSEVESLKQLLYREKDDAGQYESAVEREQKLVDLLKSAQEEREALLVKIEQLTLESQEARTGNASKDEQIGQLRERVRTLECTLDAKHAEHKLLDQELAQAKDQCSGKQIEINRLTDLLDNARTKITELEQDRALSDKSELDELLDNARKEKDALESEVAHLKEQLAISKNEIEKLKEQVSILQEECKVTRNNAKTTQSDLEYKCEKLQKDKNALNEQLQEFQEALNELQVQSQCQLEDKRQLSSVLSETQRNLSEAERKNQNLENELDELKKHIEVETADWEKFQDDLLTSVRVANDFKTEAQQELQRMILENKAFRDREKQLRAEIEKLKGETVKRGPTKTSSSRQDPKMDVLTKRPNKNEPKKRRDSYQRTVSSGSKSNRSLSEPAVARPVKKRKIKPSKQKRLKTLSVEEETLLKSLDTYNKRIDKNIPDENLTEEQRVIRKLKVIYEDELLKVKPVAPKAKDQLAISKPLLDSVLSNPKLLEIVGNPNVRTIEDMATFAKETPEIRTLIQGIDRTARGKSEDLGRPVLTKRISIIGRSMSYDDMYEFQNDDRNPSLYRTVEADDLTRDILLSITPRESSIVPSDSASNKRYSDFAVLANKDEERKPGGDLHYSTLDRIVKSIPKDTPETQLSNEQKFALRLSQALEKRKNTLKKLSKAKNLPISEPTYDSVINNPKLEEILHDPDIIEVSRRKSDILAPSDAVEVLRSTKSYDNINFVFSTSGASVEDYSAELISPLDSSSDLSGAEFNLDTGVTGPYDSKVSEACRQVQFISSLGVETAQKEPIISGEKPFKTTEKFSTFFDSKAAQRKPANLDENIADSNQEKERDSVTSRTLKSSERMKTIKGEEHDSLTYNDTLNKQKERTETPKTEPFVKVDLLQEKIRKIVNNDKKSASAADNKIKDISTTKPKTNADRPIESSKPKEYVSLRYNETLNKKLKSEADSEAHDTRSISNDIVSRNVNKNEEQRTEMTGWSDSRNVRQYDEKMKNISEKLEVIHRLITEDTNENTLTPVEIVTSNNVPSDLKLRYEEFDDGKDVPNLSSDQKLEVIHRLITEDTNENTLTPVEIVTSNNVPSDLKLRYEEFDDGKDVPNLSSDQMPVEQSVVAKTNFRDHSVGEDDTDSSETTDGKFEKNTQEYDYHAILRENRFGVKPPLNYRLSYKDVVHEIKNRFSTDDHGIDVTEKDEPENDDNYGNLFTLRRTYGLESLDKEGPSDNVTEIDREMEDIFHKYLNTRVSKIIKESEVKPLEKVKKFPDIITPVPGIEKCGDQLRSVDVTPKDENDLPKEIPIPKPRKLNTQVSADDLVVDVLDIPVEDHQSTHTDVIIHEITSSSVEGVEGNRNANEIETIFEGNSSYELPRNFQSDQTTSSAIEDIEDVNERKSFPHQKEEINLKITGANQCPHAAEEDYSEAKCPYELPTNSHFDRNKTNDIEDTKNVNIVNTILQAEDLNLGDTVSDDPLKGDARHNSTENYEASYANIKFPEFTKPSIENRKTKKNASGIETYLQENDSSELPSNFQLAHNKSNNMESTEHMSEEETLLHKAEESKLKDIQKNHPPHLTHEDYSKMTVVLFENVLSDFETVDSSKGNSPTLITYPVESSQQETDGEDQTKVHKLQQDDSNTSPKKQQTRKTGSVVDNVGISVVKLSDFGQPGIVVPDIGITKSEEDPPVNWKPNDHDGEPLTEEEVRIIQRAKKKRLSRPLSDFSADDLEFIKRISTSYSLEDEYEPQTISMSYSGENEQHGQLQLLENKNEPESAYDSVKIYELPEDSSDFDRGDYKIDPPLSFHDPPSSSTPQVSKDSSHESRVESCNNHISSRDSQEPDFSQDEFELKPPLPFIDPPSLPPAEVLEDIFHEHLVQPFDHHRSSEDIQKSNQSVSDRTKELDLVPIASERGSPDKKNEKHSSLPNKSAKSDLDALLLRMTSPPRNKSRFKNVQRTDLSLVTKENKETSNKRIENVPTCNIKSDEIPILSSGSTDAVVLRSTNRVDINRTTGRSSSGLVTSASKETAETNQNIVRMRRERPVSAPKVVKSFAQHFERLSLEKSKKHQSFHTTNIVRSRHIDRTSFSTLAQNNKKPTLPVPRHKNQDSKSSVKSCDTSHNISNDDKDLEVRKMLGNEKNFSDSQHNVPQNVSVVELCQKEITEVPGLHETRNLPTEGPQEVVEGTKEDSGETVTIEKSETPTETMITPNEEKVRDEVDDQGNVASGTSATYSTIEVAGKSEQLDITKTSECDIEDDFVENVSDVNLFSLEAPSFDDSYLSLFKSPEIKAMEQFSGKKPRKGFINITYLGEVSDSESYDDIDSLEKSFLHGTGSKPKIIDFVPLDEATKPVFEKEELPNYNTLEREKTYQVLSSAVSSAKEKEANRNSDSVAASKLKQSGSRSSFSAAKKLFEDLQAKSGSKTDKQVTRKPSTNEKLGNVESAKSSNSGSVKKTIEELEK